MTLLSSLGSLLFTIVMLIVTLGILIVVHEYGHYRVARWCGVHVPRFSIGYGTPILRLGRTASGTEFVVAPIPLGGYVTFLQERDADGVLQPPEKLPFTFERATLARRMAIVLAGPLANLILAIFVYWALHVTGVLEPRAVLAAPPAATPAAQAGLQEGDVVRAVDGVAVRSWNELNWRLLEPALDRGAAVVTVERGNSGEQQLRLDMSQLTRAQLDSNPLSHLGLVPDGTPRIGRLTSGGAGERDGLHSGDLVLAVNGQPVASAGALRDRIRASPLVPMELSLERESQRLAIVVTPAAVIDDSASSDGADTGTARTIGRIGAEIGEQLDLVAVRYGPVEGLTRAVVRTWEGATFSLRMIAKMIVGEVSWKNISGPVTIADVSGKAARAGLDKYLNVLALISISIAVLNLLPIPVLDGGHLLYYFIELVRGSPPAEWAVQWGQRLGFTTLVLLTALALFNDISRLLL